MTKFHSHHTTPVHLGGENSPQVIMTAEDHAEHHAIRFLNGEDNGFHMGLLIFLSEEMEMMARQRQSELMRTEWNPGFGTSFVEGRLWWTNGVEEVLEFECPPGWRKGRLPESQETREKKSESQIGKIWWNNGTEEKWSHDQPEGFVKGRLPHRGNKWKPVILTDTITGETTTFESQKLCREFLKVTKKVLEGKLRTGKLIHNRFTVSKG